MAAAAGASPTFAELPALKGDLERLQAMKHERARLDTDLRRMASVDADRPVDGDIEWYRVMDPAARQQQLIRLQLWFRDVSADIKRIETDHAVTQWKAAIEGGSVKRRQVESTEADIVAKLDDWQRLPASVLLSPHLHGSAAMMTYLKWLHDLDITTVGDLLKSTSVAGLEEGHVGRVAFSNINRFQQFPQTDNKRKKKMCPSINDVTTTSVISAIRFVRMGLASARGTDDVPSMN